MSSSGSLRRGSPVLGLSSIRPSPTSRIDAQRKLTALPWVRFLAGSPRLCRISSVRLSGSCCPVHGRDASWSLGEEKVFLARDVVWFVASASGVNWLML